jgi:hypothetical protein
MVPVATMGTKTHETELTKFGSVFHFTVAACYQSFDHPAATTGERGSLLVIPPGVTERIGGHEVGSRLTTSITGSSICFSILSRVLLILPRILTALANLLTIMNSPKSHQNSK